MEGREKASDGHSYTDTRNGEGEGGKREIDRDDEGKWRARQKAIESRGRGKYSLERVKTGWVYKDRQPYKRERIEIRRGKERERER